VYGIVRQSGGAIWVHSELGQGATFKVYLPWVRSELEPAGTAAPPARSLHGVETVLFVDDDAQLRALAERALRSHGYQVLVGANGEEALTLMTGGAQSVDLLITDVVMPRMQGPELARRLRAIHPGVRVLYITGYTERVIEDQERSTAATVLQKPFTPSGLLRSVREILDAA